jgi:predicted patatin/cPLA2 family phospholipase
MDNQTLNKIIRKKVIWAEIKAKEQEYQRIQKQIDELEQAKKDISFQVQKRLDESEEIGAWLDQQEYESLKDIKKEEENPQRRWKAKNQD